MQHRCDGVRRRDFLRVGALSALGMSLPEVLRGRALASSQSLRAKNCILIWLDGGPSHLEMFDPKPNAPVEIRGPLKPISTSVAGVHLSESMPKTAERMHRLAIIRSMTSTLGEHNFGTHYLLTGYRPTPAIEYPFYGSVVTHVRRTLQDLPPNIAIPNLRVGGGKYRGNGYLPSPTFPFELRADPAAKDFRIPDLQFHFLAGAGAEAGVPSVPKGSSGITLNSYTVRPKARGTVRLRSANPNDTPLIDPNFLGHPDDLKTSVEGVKISRDIFSQPSLQKYVRRIRFPDDSVKTQKDFEEYARQYGRTSYHPTCTCKMGTDEMSVVDPQCRVRGLDGIRICDSSIMPSLIGSNTNAPTIMIAEKASDMIRGNK